MVVDHGCLERFEATLQQGEGFGARSAPTVRLVVSNSWWLRVAHNGNGSWLI